MEAGQDKPGTAGVEPLDERVAEALLSAEESRWGERIRWVLGAWPKAPATVLREQLRECDPSADPSKVDDRATALEDLYRTWSESQESVLYGGPAEQAGERLERWDRVLAALADQVPAFEVYLRAPNSPREGRILLRPRPSNVTSAQIDGRAQAEKDPAKRTALQKRAVWLREQERSYEIFDVEETRCLGRMSPVRVVLKQALCGALLRSSGPYGVSRFVLAHETLGVVTEACVAAFAEEVRRRHRPEYVAKHRPSRRWQYIDDPHRRMVARRAAESLSRRAREFAGGVYQPLHRETLHQGTLTLGGEHGLDVAEADDTLRDAATGEPVNTGSGRRAGPLAVLVGRLDEVLPPKADGRRDMIHAVAAAMFPDQADKLDVEEVLRSRHRSDRRREGKRRGR